MDHLEPRWRLVFLIEPKQVLQLLATTEPDTLMRINAGIPRDARFVRMHVEPASQCLWAVFEHPVFEANYIVQGLTFCDDTALLLAPTPYQTCYTGPAVRAVISELEGE